VEFWRRWHISLSTWFRDYVYIPLGGSRASRGRQAFNLIVTFVLSGLWHGANWTYIIWGLLNGLYVVPRVFMGDPLAGAVRSPNLLIRVPTLALRIGGTFALILLAWIFFRARDIATAGHLLHELFSRSLLKSPAATLRNMGVLGSTLYSGLAIALLVTIEWFQRDKRYALEIDSTRAVLARWPLYACIAAVILLFRYTGRSLDFIYFQF
jgi:D-alanyl-lipoteichoic acid acyltransferase DltB (MBOAT superfamily)